jgi:hypothetical protein
MVETVTSKMRDRREAALTAEKNLTTAYLDAGVPNAEIIAHVESVIGEKNPKPSPTPKTNPNYPEPRV